MYIFVMHNAIKKVILILKMVTAIIGLFHWFNSLKKRKPDFLGIFYLPNLVE